MSNDEQSPETTGKTLIFEGYPDVKGIDRFGDALVRAHAANKGAAGLVIADATKRLARITEKAQGLKDGWEQLEMTQNRGPTVKFTGRQLAADGFVTQDDREGGMEVWETRGGALVALSYLDIPSGGEDRRVKVVEPIFFPPGAEWRNARLIGSPPEEIDHRAMQRAVLDHFNWDRRAMSMVREQLDWDLSLEVE